MRGPAAPAGPAGPQGAPGAKGDVGATGPASRLINDSFGAQTTGGGPYASALEISKPVDASSPALLAAMRSGSAFPQVVVHRTGADGQVDTTYTLTDARIVALSDSTGLSFDENLQLDYTQIETTTKLADASSVTTCWDTVAKQAC